MRTKASVGPKNTSMWSRGSIEMPPMFLAQASTFGLALVPVAWMMSICVEMRLSTLSAAETIELLEREIAGISALSTVRMAAILATVIITVQIAFSIYASP